MNKILCSLIFMFCAVNAFPQATVIHQAADPVTPNCIDSRIIFSDASDNIFIGKNGACFNFNTSVGTGTVTSVGNINLGNFSNCTVSNPTTAATWSCALVANIDLRTGVTDITLPPSASFFDMLSIANPATPAAGRVRLHSKSSNGFSRLEEDTSTTQDIVLHRDNIVLIHNVSGIQITTGVPLYTVAGGTAEVPDVDFAKADSLTTMPAIGLSMGTIAIGGYGYVMVSGVLENQDTSTLAANDTLYVDCAVAGQLTITRPVSPCYAQRIATVLTVDATAGSGLIATAPFVGGIESGTTSNYTFAGTVTVDLLPSVTMLGTDGGGELEDHSSSLITLPAQLGSVCQDSAGHLIACPNVPEPVAVGTGGATQYYIQKWVDAAADGYTDVTTQTDPIAGVATTTGIAGATILLTRSGTGTCTAEGTVTNGHWLIEGSSVKGKALDSGQTLLSAISDSTPVLGIALAGATDASFACWIAPQYGAKPNVANATGLLPTANQAVAANERPCEITIGSVGTGSVALADSNDATNSCLNNYGATLTIQAVTCYSDAGSPTVTPVLTAGGAILSGDCTCDQSEAGGTCTLSGTPTQADAKSINGAITTAGGVAKYIKIYIKRTL